MLEVKVSDKNAREVSGEQLLAMIDYCYEQVSNSGGEIEVLNSNKLGGDSQQERIADIHDAILDLLYDDKHKQLLVVAAEDSELEELRDL